MLKIIVTEPLCKFDEDVAHVLDVSRSAFEKNPNKVYEIPDTAFWKKELLDPNGRYKLAPEKEKKEAPKPKEVPNAKK